MKMGAPVIKLPAIFFSISCMVVSKGLSQFCTADVSDVALTLTPKVV